ncbi:MAG: adenylate/guanylate cyclase domain-containing protein [Bacteroidota bacterium]
MRYESDGKVLVEVWLAGTLPIVTVESYLAYFYHTMFQRVKSSALLFSTIYWVLTTNFYVLIRFAGDLSEEGQPIRTIWLHLQVTITAIIIGMLLNLLNHANLGGSRAKKSFGWTVLVNTAIYLLFFAIVIFLSSLYGNTFDFAKSFFLSTESLVALAFMTVNSLIFHFILQMNRLLGPEVLMEYISGKYFTPVEEERIFMFLDLKSSTTIAEQLGHSSYSKLIQDCFSIVSTPAQRNGARIYQYVGDEVVLTWKFSSESTKACIGFFFHFQQLLNDQSEYFLEQYEVVPEFKAGVHFGQVMVTQVGELKSEIAYHGDVLNAAARIQGMCNQFEASFLISERLLTQIYLPDAYTANYLGNLILKGKQERIKVHSINMAR